MRTLALVDREESRQVLEYLFNEIRPGLSQIKRSKLEVDCNGFVYHLTFTIHFVADMKFTYTVFDLTGLRCLCSFKAVCRISSVRTTGIWNQAKGGPDFIHASSRYQELLLELDDSSKKKN